MKKYSPEEFARRTRIIEEADRSNFGWKEARSLVAGDFVTMSTAYDQGMAFPVGLARLLGLYLAEGNLVKQGGKYRAVEFSFSIAEKDTLAKETQTLLRDELGVDSYLYVRKSSNQCQVRTSWNKDVVDWFENHGGHYSWGKTLSENVLSWNRESLGALVGGWIDGDGCIVKDGKMVVATVSHNLASQMGVILSRLGVYHNWNIRKARKSKDGVNHRESHYLTIPSSVVPIVLPFVTRWNKSKESGRVFCRQLHEDFIMVKITKVEVVRPMEGNNPVIDVFCLEVEGDHSFQVGGGIGVENCLADWVTCSRCGKVMGDNVPNCRHLDHELLAHFVDKKGVERVVAELCGRTLVDKDGKRIGDPKSVRFIEASWVERPAFFGAVLNHYVSDLPKAAAQVLQLSTGRLQLAVDDLFRLRVADKAGMMVLRVAQAELYRRRREAMIDRIARSVL